MQREINKVIDRAFKEDMSDKDLTTNILFDKNKVSEAYIMTREKSLICGVNIVKRIFRKLDPAMKITCYKYNGDLAKRNDKIIRVISRWISNYQSRPKWLGN